MHYCIPSPTTDSNTSMGMIWVTLNMPRNHQGNVREFHIVFRVVTLMLPNSTLLAVKFWNCITRDIYCCLTSDSRHSTKQWQKRNKVEGQQSQIVDFWLCRPCQCVPSLNRWQSTFDKTVTKARQSGKSTTGCLLWNNWGLKWLDSEQVIYKW